MPISPRRLAQVPTLSRQAGWWREARCTLASSLPILVGATPRTWGLVPQTWKALSPSRKIRWKRKRGRGGGEGKEREAEEEEEEVKVRMKENEVTWRFGLALGLCGGSCLEGFFFPLFLSFPFSPPPFGNRTSSEQRTFSKGGFKGKENTSFSIAGRVPFLTP